MLLERFLLFIVYFLWGFFNISLKTIFNTSLKDDTRERKVYGCYFILLSFGFLCPP